MAVVTKHPVELTQRVVGMVRELERKHESGRGAVARVATQLGLNPETLRAGYAKTTRADGPGLRSDRCGDTLCPGMDRRWR
ncbi:MAG: hypothetical protein JO100_03125 [Pseudonocardia sp.]|nr:hypothetical protein [Pseudonocardia sp.]